MLDFNDSMASTELQQEGGSAYVWADDGNGRLEKRAVELGEYDPNLDEYEIVSGLSEDDLIAWPMEGLYEGVRTVTDAEEVDYTSDLYNQEMGTESIMDGGFMEGTESMLDGGFMEGTEGVMDGGFMDDGLLDGDMTDGMDEDGASDVEGAE